MDRVDDIKHGEKISRLLRSLQAAPLTEQEALPLIVPACSLESQQKNKNKCSQCAGVGFYTRAHLGLIHADLCLCVKKCERCLGSCKKIEDGLAKDCTLPCPVKVIRLINNAELPGRYLHVKLNDFKNNSGNNKKVHHLIETWLKQFKDPTPPAQIKGFILGGNVGVGKTFLLVAVAKYLTHLGVDVRFVDFFQLVSQIKLQIAKGLQHDSLLAPLMNAQVLVIDELGKGRQTEFEHTVIDQLVMGRYNQNKIIVASTNCQLNSDLKTFANRDLERSDASQFIAKHFPPLIETVGERVYSRLVETAHFWELTGDDYRRKK